MSRAVSPSASRPYGVLRVPRRWGVARATVYRQRRRPPEAIARARPGPRGALPDDELVEEIRALLEVSPFHGEGYRKIWARLRFSGIRTSRRRVLRLMRQHGLLAPGRVGRPHGPRAHDGTIRTERVDEMRGTDLTSVLTGEGVASIFVAVSTTARPSASASTPPSVPPGSRRWSRSARACASGSAASPRPWRAA